MSIGNGTICITLLIGKDSGVHIMDEHVAGVPVQTKIERSLVQGPLRHCECLSVKILLHLCLFGCSFDCV